ncbi:MAG: efflux RND transporter periplasmic adaptor subunit [Phycisphaerae bacterium]|nr:efflux RND transporter periplasmic adaptor subunit [Phycisphaerae bacterium]
MSQASAKASRWLPIVKGVAIGIGFLVVVVLLMMWLMGSFSPKIGAAEQAQPVERLIGDTRLVPVRKIRLPATESAVGSVRAVQQVAVASKIRANVIEVNVVAGQEVKKGDVLVRLDDADLKARLQQAEAAVIAARAKRDQAKIEMERISDLLKKNAAAKIEYERTDTSLKTAVAELEQAEQVASEAKTILMYATITAPMAGKVIDKKVESGDTVTPGQVLVTLYDNTRMQLVASVRESLTQRLKVGQEIGVRLESLSKACMGSVSEIVPEAESASRTFSVKVTGPCPPNVYPGMFGRILIPLDEEEYLVIPKAAVRRVGQLTVVGVADGSLLRRRAVQLGRAVGDDVQVLSGLREGEKVAIVASTEPSREGV